MAKFRSYEERHAKRSARFDGKRAVIENGEQMERMWLENDEPRSATSSETDIVLICDLCSSNVEFNNMAQLLDRVFHRVPCAERMVEEILDEEAESPGRFDGSTLSYVRALRSDLRAERWRERLSSLRSILQLE